MWVKWLDAKLPEAKLGYVIKAKMLEKWLQLDFPSQVWLVFHLPQLKSQYFSVWDPPKIGGIEGALRVLCHPCVSFGTVSEHDQSALRMVPWKEEEVEPRLCQSCLDDGEFCAYGCCLIYQGWCCRHEGISVSGGQGFQSVEVKAF